jgi:ABC-type uncharacterized transport system substrate-binding protein
MNKKKGLMDRWKRNLFWLLIPAFCLSFLLPGRAELFASDTKAGARAQAPAKWKILHIMSYHSPWQWTDDMFNGFKEALKGLDIEYKVFQMDTKRNSSEEWKQKVGKEARELIQAWKPDLVYTTDDNAQEYVTRHYIDAKIPFVFAGVNDDPEKYGFVGAKNVTGVLEREHIEQTVTLLKEVVPGISRIAVITDEDPTWEGVTRRMKEKESIYPPHVQFISYDVIQTFEEYKRKIKEYQTKADALGLLGIHTFKDEKGSNVPWEEVLKWTADNSRLPDFSFWADRVLYGTLCAVIVSAYEQGLGAGRIARGILVEGKSPSSYAIKPTIKGRPMLSLARARKLGLRVKSKVLLTADVIEKFEWDK